MKNYKDFEKVFIGDSDVAALIVAGNVAGEGLKTHILKFGGDGAYYAYIIDEQCEIPAHYEKVAVFNGWMRVYDDEALRRKFYAEKITIFRAGDYGCIVFLQNESM